MLANEDGVTVPYNSRTARPLAEGGSDLESDSSLVVFALGCPRVVTEDCLVSPLPADWGFQVGKCRLTPG